MSSFVCSTLDHGATKWLGTSFPPPQSGPVADPNIQTFMMITVASAFVILMQVGFALVEAGNVGEQSVSGVLLKNVGNFAVGLLAWFTFGYAFAFGNTYYNIDGNEPTTATQWFIGDGAYFTQNLNPCYYPFWFFDFTIAAVSSAIACSSMGGRVKTGAQVAFTFFFMSWVYPTVAHWTQSQNAWLVQGSIDDNNRGVGYVDFGGSGFIHVVGGAAALVAAKVAGARDNKDTKSTNPSHVATGTMIIMFGFIGLLLGQNTLTGTTSAVTMSLILINLFLAASGGVVTVLLTSFGGADLLNVCNGAISGMVAVSAGANTIYPWGGFVTGLFAGVIYIVYNIVVKKGGLDDPSGAFAVHFGSGAWGLIAVTLFAMDKESTLNQYPNGGIFFDSDERSAWVHLGWNFFAIFMIFLWVAANVAIFLTVLAKVGLMSVDEPAAKEEGAPGVDEELGMPEGTEVKTSQI